MFINAIPNGRNNDIEDDYVDNNDDNDDYDDNDDNEASDDNGVNDDSKDFFSVCNIHNFIFYIWYLLFF